MYQRIQAVLLIARGYSVDDVARITGSLRRLIYHWIQRYLRRHRVDDLDDASRTGRMHRVPGDRGWRPKSPKHVSYENWRAIL